MLPSQRALFDLPREVCYLNTAGWFFFQAEDGIRDIGVTGVQTCALPIFQTVDVVFVEHLLPKGEMLHRGKPVDLTAIRRCAIMAVEGEKDDISGVGQTLAARSEERRVGDEGRYRWYAEL